MNLHTRGIYFHPFVRPPVLWVPPLAGGFFSNLLPPVISTITRPPKKWLPDFIKTVNVTVDLPVLVGACF
jgi:hypothetical protein